MTTSPGDHKAKRAAKLDRTVIDSAAGQFEDEQIEQVKLAPGLKIEQYELIRELGRGGMGQVFLARDTRLGRRVAMKFMQSSSPRFSQRWLAEARATARCHHENIVAIFSADNYVGMPYMVLEFIEGTTLGKLMGGKRMPAARAIELMVPVVRALTVAHASSIIHRDLKPDNILVTKSGTVKVLDFGVAKLAALGDDESTNRPRPRAGTEVGLHDTRAGAIVGTLPYMSPEQLGTDTVDHRSDLWAVGIILYEMLAAEHPLAPLTEGRLFGAAAAVDEPMPSLGEHVPGLPDRLVEIVARCLAKKKQERYANAQALLEDLETLLPARTGRSLVADESPYPGLVAFQESDANRFFGRSRDIAETVARLRDRPLVGIVGPSGVGKSSFIRAGVVPALKVSGESWECHIIRPGRDPLNALASALESLRDSRDSDPSMPRDPAQQLRHEPGIFGTRLRSRARRRRTQILVFVDQFEELYTLVGDPAERAAFTACLASAGDDPASPLRVVVSMRSDFLDRAAEDRRFLDELTRGLGFLQPPDRAGLQQALIQPVEMLGYQFEDGIVGAMLDTLESTPGPLPLLQFSAAKLWALRDKQRRVLTRDAYHAMGGVAGALATHADEVLATFTGSEQKVVRAIFQRLVTPERTRAVIETKELRAIAHASDVERLIGRLVEARLLVVQQRGESESAVELVHESLIRSWPTLQHWLDENQEHAAYLQQIAVAAKAWDAKGRPGGLLWSGEAMEEARLFNLRFRGQLPAREHAFLAAVNELATRAVRRKRRLVLGTMAILAFLTAATFSALVYIRQQQQIAESRRVDAESASKLATQQAIAAKEAKELAQKEAERALRAETQQRAQYEALIEAIQDKNASAVIAARSEIEKKKAEKAAKKATEQAAKTVAETEEQKKRAAEEALAAEKKRKEALKKGQITDSLK
jgi:eukaryotic-like serine/threonine-protein kinase